MMKKVLSSQLGYNLVVADYDKKEAYLNSFEKEVVWDLLGDIDGKRVLEVGAGTGRLTVKLVKLGAKVTAMDVAEEMLSMLKSKVKSLKSKLQVKTQKLSSKLWLCALEV